MESQFADASLETTRGRSCNHSSHRLLERSIAWKAAAALNRTHSRATLDLRLDRRALRQDSQR